MKMRRLVSVLLSLCIVLGIVSNSISATETVASGSCGDNLIWVLDSQGTLTIQGQGEMWDWAHIAPPYSAAYSTAPWYTYCNDIKEVVIQEGVTSIGDCAFLYCTNLSVVKIPEGVTNIEMSAFEACRSLRAINIPSTVTYVSAGTFKCTGLREIVLPRNLSFLGAVAFYGCTDLQNVYFLGDAPQLGYFPENTFAECSKDLTIYYVPSKSGWTGSAWKTYSLATWEGYEEAIQPTEIYDTGIENDSESKSEISFCQVVCGGSHTAAISTSGDLFVWGRGDHGEIGNGAFENQNFPQKVLDNVQKVCIGFSHTAAIKKNGDLYVWGNNNYGQIGNGTNINQATPTKVLADVISVAIDDGRTAAVTQNGDLYIWGRNNCGEVGMGVTGNQVTPIKVMEDVIKVVLGSNYSVALKKGGEVYCWGSNKDGQLGVKTVEESNVPLLVMENVIDINVNAYTTFALTKDNNVFAWGKNTFSDTGTGKSVHYPVSEPSRISAVGKAFGKGIGLICDDNSLLLWGFNAWGSVGNGTTSDHQTYPVKVISNVKLFATDGHSVAVNNDDILFCWGDNANGQIGNGTTNIQTFPIQILENITAVDIGFSHTAAITKNGELYVWGGNNYGQVGNGTNDNQLTPFKISIENISYEEKNDDKTASSTEKNEEDVQTSTVTYAKSFNEFFVENKIDNVQALVDYESVARVVCEESSSAEIYWNAYLSALSDNEFLSVDNIGDASLSPLKMHHYYEAALLEAIMQTKLENDYLSAIGERALKTAVEAASFCVQYNSEFESREDVLKRKLKEETRDLDRDGEEIIKIYEYYGKKCKDLETYDVVKSIYDLCIETEATVEEFHQALSNYVEVKRAGDEVLAALEYLKGYLELSNDKEDKIILTAVENVITSMTITLDTQLVYNVLESMQDQFWNMMIGMAEDLLGEYFLVAKAAKMCIDGGLLLMDVLFPTATSSKSYCKLYADFAIEWVVQDAICAAYDEYSISPRKEMADAIVGLYDVLAYTYQHEIRVGDILVDQLHKDGLLNGLRNLVSSSNMEDHRYEKACIQSYDAYLAEITKVKVEAQREYGIAIGKLQPVYIVYFINGKALLFEEFTAETGVPYIPPVERAQTVADVLGFTADVFGFTANVMGVYVDSSMKKAYDDTVPVSGPVVLFMDIGLFDKSDGTPALVDPATKVSVTKTSLPMDTKINVIQEAEGNTFAAASTHFEGKNIEVYDISLSSEKGEIQPFGDVTVSIPLGASYEKYDVSVYYMNPNGTYEDMEAMVEDGYCKFTTTHFSTYVIVYESNDTLNNLTIAICVVSAAALVVFLVIIRARRRKKNS